MLTLNVTEGDVCVRVRTCRKGILTSNLKVSMSNHHQLDMAFNSKQITHLIITPTKGLLGDTVEILDFPPAQVVADNGLRCERVIGADKIAPRSLPNDTIDDQSDTMSTGQTPAWARSASIASPAGCELLF